MKVTNGYILDAKPSLESVLNLPSGALSTKGKYWLSRLGRVLTNPLKSYQEDFNDLVKVYGHKEGRGYTVSEADRLEEFNEELAKLRAIEVLLDWTFTMLTEKDAQALTGGHMMALDQFIAFPEPTEELPEVVPADGKIKDMPLLTAVK